MHSSRSNTCERIIHAIILSHDYSSTCVSTTTACTVGSLWISINYLLSSVIHRNIIYHYQLVARSITWNVSFLFDCCVTYVVSTHKNILPFRIIIWIYSTNTSTLLKTILAIVTRRFLFVWRVFSWINNVLAGDLLHHVAVIYVFIYGWFHCARLFYRRCCFFEFL